MRVIKLEANVVVVPLSKPISFATRVVTERHYLLVRILTESGDEGIGFSYIGNKELDGEYGSNINSYISTNNKCCLRALKYKELIPLV